MDRIKILERGVIFLYLTTTILFVLGLFISQYPKWWNWIIFERTPMTFVEAILLYSCAFMALLNFGLTFILEKNRDSIKWLTMSLGFAYLTFDERFAIHERIRDSFLIPNNINLPFITWTSAGDYILLILMIFGLLIFYKTISIIKKRKSSFYIFICGVILAIVAIVMDSIDVHKYSLDIQRKQQFIEEIFETFAMLMFFISIWLLFMKQIKDNINLKEK